MKKTQNLLFLNDEQKLTLLMLSEDISIISVVAKLLNTLFEEGNKILKLNGVTPPPLLHLNMFIYCRVTVLYVFSFCSLYHQSITCCK